MCYSAALLSFIECRPITATKSPLFFRTTFSTSLTKLMVLLPQSRDRTCYVSRSILAPHRSEFRNILLYAHMTSLTLTNCDSVGSLTLLAPNAGDFVEFLLLHQTADIRQVYYLTFMKHTAAGLKAVMCDSATSVLSNF